MKATDVMVTKVISVTPDVLVQDVAYILLSNRISAVPVVDDNGQLLGAPGNFMYLGHQISPAKLQYDLHRPISDPATAGSIHFTKAFGPENTAWSTTGELGLPGQLENFAQMWGAGGP